MRQTKYSLILSIIIFCQHHITAQVDPHYSLNAQPLYYSPSLTGVFDGSVRFSSVYRTQWKSALGSNQYETVGAALDFQLPAQDGDVAGLGFSSWNDQSSVNNFRQRFFNISGAFAKKVGQNRSADYKHYLSIGGQLGLGELRVSSNSFLFSTQFDGVWVDRNLPNQEGFASGDLNTQFININTGLSYYLINSKKGNYALIGASAYHVNTPNISLFQADGVIVDMPVRWSIYESCRFKISDKLALVQYGTFNLQAPFSQLIVGGQIRYQPQRESKALRIGTTVRVGRFENITEIDAVSPTIGLELNQVFLQAAFDMNISEFSEFTNYRGGMEIAIIYMNPQKRKKGVACPRF